MVGVPRSKACITCRKRRKGVSYCLVHNESRRLTAMQCDTKQPSCGQCEKLGVDCEGYARERLFVNATKQGVLFASTNRSNRSVHATSDNRSPKLSWSSYKPNGQAPSLHTKARAGTSMSPTLSLYPSNFGLGVRLNSSAPPEGRQRLERELMHRWKVSGYMNLCCLPEDASSLQLELPRWAMGRGYLTDGIFALALVEGVLRRDSKHTSAPQSQFVRLAMEYYDASSASFRAELRHLTPENIHIAYAYSIIVVIVNIALVQCRYNDKTSVVRYKGILQHVTGLMELFIGSSWVVDQHMHWILKSPLGPLIHRATSHWTPVSDKPIEGPVDTALTRLMRVVNATALIAGEGERDPAAARLDTYQGAVRHLRKCFAISMHSEMRGFGGEFPALAGRDFVQYVKERDPVALFILVHWAALLQYVDSWTWWARPFGRTLAHEISDFLTENHSKLAATPEWRENIAWAKDEVESPSSYNPRGRLQP